MQKKWKVENKSVLTYAVKYLYLVRVYKDCTNISAYLDIALIPVAINKIS